MSPASLALRLLGDELIYFGAGDRDWMRQDRRRWDAEARVGPKWRRRLYRRGCEDADGGAGRAEAGRLRLGVVEFEIDQRAFATGRSICAAWCGLFPASLQLFKIAQQFIGYFVMRRNHCSSSRCSTRYLRDASSPIDDLLIGEHRGGTWDTS